MKMIKLLLSAAVVIAAGILVWNLMWMQEMGNKYDVNQLRQEALELEGESRKSIGDVTAKTERAIPAKEEEIVRSMPQPAEEKPMEEPPQEKRVELKPDVVSRK